MSSIDQVESSTTGSPAVEYPTSQQDKPARYAYKALAASLAGNILDTFDNLLLGFLLVAISAEFHLSRPEAGSIATATLIGAVVGGILFGIRAWGAGPKIFGPKGFSRGRRHGSLPKYETTRGYGRMRGGKN